MAQMIDLRGQRLVQELAPVLADPSGRRARYLGRAGRAIAVVFLLWLLGLLLAGVGILPAGDLPLGRSVVSQAPRLRSLPRPAQPTRGELLPARAAAGTSTGGAARTRPGFAANGSIGPVAGAGPAASAGTAATATPGNGHSRTGASPGVGARSGGAAGATPAPVAPATASPGNSGTHAHLTGGNSASAPGHIRKATTTTTTTTTTVPGHSATAPGQTGNVNGHHG